MQEGLHNIMDGGNLWAIRLLPLLVRFTLQLVSLQDRKRHHYVVAFLAQGLACMFSGNGTRQRGVCHGFAQL